MFTPFKTLHLRSVITPLLTEVKGLWNNEVLVNSHIPCLVSGHDTIIICPAEVFFIKYPNKLVGIRRSQT